MSFASFKISFSLLPYNNIQINVTYIGVLNESIRDIFNCLVTLKTQLKESV